jgi:hypothetical protein
MRLFLIFAFALFCAIPPLSAQGNGIDQDSELVVVGSDKFLRWYGHDARTYFVQVSDPNDHLNTWTWAPIIESGNDEFISYEVDGTAEKGFFRLTSTDQVPGANETLETADFDNDGIPNWEEIAFHLTNPLNADTDGDGMTDGWEVLYFLNPTSILDRLLDLDGDGLSNINEYNGCTSPINSDSDGDGVSDGDEVAQGTDPCAAASFTIQWHRVTRRLIYDFDEYPPPNNKGTLSKTSEWDAALNTNEMLTAAIPFPDLKARLEMIAFPAAPPAAGGTNGLAPSTGHSTLLPNPPCFHATMSHQRLWLRRVQAETAAFQQRAFIVTTRTIDGVAEPKTFESKDIIIPANDTTSAFVDLNKGFTQNFTGNVYHYETFTGRLCPLELRQTNMPNIGVPENSTDLNGARGERMIGVGGIAYVTGEPAVPQLRAKFRDMPESVSVEWRLEVRSERTERGTLDDRDFPALNQSGQPQWVTLAGDAEWDITAAMASEFVGGNCTLHYRVDGANDGSVTFRLRGKNPLDAAASAHIDASVGASFTAYAYGMPRHESRFGPRAYNQFNARITNGTPFWGGPDGWGMCQIDRRSNREIPGHPDTFYPPDHPGLTPNQYTTTVEVWNWHTNVVSMNAKLIEKQAVYNRFIGYFRDSYGTNTNWSEPPTTHTEGSTTLPAEAWGVMVLYNGISGVPASTTPTHQSPAFNSPWTFNPTTGAWAFHDNFQNYATARVRPELDTSTIPTQE